jgi:hypothetical protein
MAHPGCSGSPDEHSRTGIADFAARRVASIDVKIAGMCCAISSGTGNCAGNEGSTRARASGPPVETPITTICTGDSNRGTGGKRRRETAGRGSKLTPTCSPGR